MLPRQNRLSSSYDFRRIRRRGRSLGSPFFSLFVLRGSPEEPSRFGFVISSRLDKRAVRRNRIRRIFQDEVRKLLDQVRPGFSAAFWLRRAGMEASPPDIRQAIGRALQKAGVVG